MSAPDELAGGLWDARGLRAICLQAKPLHPDMLGVLELQAHIPSDININNDATTLVDLQVNVSITSKTANHYDYSYKCRFNPS